MAISTEITVEDTQITIEMICLLSSFPSSGGEFESPAIVFAFVGCSRGFTKHKSSSHSTPSVILSISIPRMSTEMTTNI